ncbi:MAG: hypothetical protein HY719_12150 [Planctomycetes bacterium]|nr:hypothetical protein [Planctomycetota bacterium]
MLWGMEEIDQWPLENVTHSPRSRAPVAISEHWVYFAYSEFDVKSAGPFLRKNIQSGEVEMIHLPKGKILWATDEEMGIDSQEKRSIDVYRVRDLVSADPEDDPVKPVRRDPAYSDEYRRVASRALPREQGDILPDPFVAATWFDRLTGRKLTVVIDPCFPDDWDEAAWREANAEARKEGAPPIDLPDVPARLTVYEQTVEHPAQVALIADIECPFRAVPSDCVGTLDVHWLPWLVIVWRTRWDVENHFPALRISLASQRIEALPRLFPPYPPRLFQEDHGLPAGEVDGWWYRIWKRDQDLVLHHPVTGETRELPNVLGGVHQEGYETPGHDVATLVNIASRIALTPVALAAEPLWWVAFPFILIFVGGPRIAIP